MALGAEERLCRCGAPFVVRPRMAKRYCCERCRAAWVGWERAHRIADAVELVVAEGWKLTAEGYEAANNLRVWLVRRPKKPDYCRPCLMRR